MDIQEAREAFERRRANALNVSYEGLKANFDENSRLFGTRYNAGSINEKEWNLWLEAWQAKAQAVPEGFVLIKDDTKTVVAIERMVEQQVEASGMDSRRLERLDGWKIIEAAVKAQEPAK